MRHADWWERRWFCAFLIIVSATPLLWPQTPPLVDVPGHMGRFRVQLDLDHSEHLQRYFEFNWALIGNLGVDLLVEFLGPLIGVELAVKLIVIAIPPLTVVGLMWIAREIHGRVPPTIMFAVPFIYGYPFNFGFINFSLSLAFALIAFGYWLRLANSAKLGLRAALFLPISCLLWITHAFGWGVLGLLAFSSELVRQRDEGSDWRSSLLRSVLAMSSLGLPLLLMLLWRTGAVAGETDQFFHILAKLFALVATLRDRWLIWDSFGVGAAVVLIGASIFDKRLERSRKLTIPTVILAVTFFIMPARVFGSAYADMRLAPLMFMTAVLAIRVRCDGLTGDRWLAWLGLAFMLLRLGGNTISFAIADLDARRWLTALAHIPKGSAVATLTGDYCSERWAMPRHTHLGSFVVIRREGFSNDQWQAAGAQLLRINYPKARYFVDDRSTFIYSDACIAHTEEISERPLEYDHSPKAALRAIPRDAFDFIWMIDPPDYKMRARPGLVPVWRTHDAILYRIDKTFVAPVRSPITD
ncbi:hypothetical protein D3M59_05785 [Sphingomonas edaphi]|uniref:Glycosyltransferase RgtA/B/C/D-like domain-containing protein n=2 Tax=Sphingomonas edaphi TaxID=2315689 RepID=A0A418Q3G4_9SPHN|nr:hypothetical protein D3M59_05785 [Sphingomonas edaphi]